MSDDNKTARKVPTMTYSRIVGYLTPIQTWNLAKRQEFCDRTTYDVTEVVNGESVKES